MSSRGKSRTRSSSSASSSSKKSSKSEGKSEGGGAGGGGGGGDGGSESVHVAIRCRPLNGNERGNGCQSWWKTTATSLKEETKPNAAGKSYYYDTVFKPMDDQECVYQKVGAPMVATAMQGYNGTVFAYGQTAAGKTYSLMGSDEDPGLTIRAVDDLFRSIQGQHNTNFLVRVSYIEIYNEKVLDLLSDGDEALKLIDDKIFGSIVRACVRARWWRGLGRARGGRRGSGVGWCWPRLRVGWGVVSQRSRRASGEPRGSGWMEIGVRGVGASYRVTTTHQQSREVNF